MTTILRPQYIGNLLFLIDLDNTLFLTDKANNLAYEKAIKDMLNKHRPDNFFEKILSLSNGRITEDIFYLLDVCKGYPFILSRFSPVGPSHCLRYDSRYLMEFDNNYPLFFSYSKVNEMLKNRDLEELLSYDPYYLQNQYELKIKIQKLINIIKSKKDEYYEYFLFTINNKSDDIFKKIREVKEKRVEPYLNYSQYIHYQGKWPYEEPVKPVGPIVFEHPGCYLDFKAIKIIVTKANEKRAKQILEYYDLNNNFDGIVFCSKEEDKYEKALNELSDMMKENDVSCKDVYIFDDDESQIKNIKERIPNENIFIV